MPEVLAKVGQFLGSWAAGKVAGADKVTLLVRFLRVLYGSFGVLISTLWYTGWRNSVTQPGDLTVPIPGVSKAKSAGWQFAARADAPPPVAEFSASAPAGGSVTGGGVSQGAGPGSGAGLPPLVPTNRKLVPVSVTGGSGYASPQKVHGHYNPREYAILQSYVQGIDRTFGLHITSGYRSPAHNAAVGGAPGSFHTEGLAFDSVGRYSDMRRAEAWASHRPDLFQEVFLHDEGSGLHLHLAFYPDVASRKQPTAAQLTGRGN